MLDIVGDVYLPNRFTISGDLGPLVLFGHEYVCSASACQLDLRKISVKADISYVRATFGERTLIAALANNHILDYGEQGLVDTKRALDENGVRYFGAASHNEETPQRIFIEDGIICIAVLNYVSEFTAPIFKHDNAYVMSCELDRIVHDIQMARGDGADRVLIYVHWGAEFVPIPRPEDVVVARALIDAGADAIIGSHAHCVQGYEYYKGRPIVYGIGNFIFPDIENKLIRDGKNVVIKTYNGNSQKRGEIVRYNGDSNEVIFLGAECESNNVTIAQGRIDKIKYLYKYDVNAYSKYYKNIYMKYKMIARLKFYIKNRRFPKIGRICDQLPYLYRGDLG